MSQQGDPNYVTAIDFNIASNLDKLEYQKMIERANLRLKEWQGEDAKQLNYIGLNNMIQERAINITNACQCYTLSDLIIDIACKNSDLLKYATRLATDCKDVKYTKKTRTWFSKYDTIGTNGNDISARLAYACETMTLKQLFYYIPLNNSDLDCSCVIDYLLDAIQELANFMNYSKIRMGMLYGDGTGNNPQGINTVAVAVPAGSDLFDTISKLKGALLANIEGITESEIVVVAHPVVKHLLNDSRTSQGALLFAGCDAICNTIEEDCNVNITGSVGNRVTDIFAFVKGHWGYGDGLKSNYSERVRVDGRDETQVGVKHYFWGRPLNSTSFVKSTVNLGI
jgi:hypothetical protein